ncbi:MAG TPA: HEAT repeat domain-containing protein [Myxococcota bacterium]|nr:HEAT repeat domain-containing protein [Myxococcota bacterium]
MSARVLAIVCSTVCVAALAACEPSGKGGGTSKPAAGGEKSGAASSLATGEVQVELKDGRVSVVCHDALRGIVVEKLAREAGFQLNGDLDSVAMNLDLHDVPMEQVLPPLLAGVSYRAQWQYQKEQDRTTLAKLEVGDVAASAVTTAAHKPKLGEALRERFRAMRDTKPSEKQKAEAAQRREERARSQADALEELRSSSPEMRMEAAAEIEPEGPALHTLMDTLSNDADARVRAKVAEQLADADGCVASMGLVTATGDPDPSVRCAAWHSLEMNCDESMLPTMQPTCARETDPKVRECCTGTLEMCE